MRIAQIAPLYESCPPQLYGGTERVVSYLTEQLVRMGHDVTLFASGDSQTKARLVPGCKRALRLDPNVADPLAYHMIMMGRVLQEAGNFDILHFHTDYLHYPTFATGPHAILTTLHGRQDLPDLVPVYREFCDTPLVSISDDQRNPLPRAHWVKTIHHGLPKDLLPFGKGDGGYLAFIGRISPEKRLDRAIMIAREAGIPLKVAAKIDKADRVYFHDVIEPLLGEPGVEFIGEINEHQKRNFLGRARALLFPIDWPEPFGLVMIEAMACGTPVLAFNCGSVTEVIDNGLTGVVVDGMEEAYAALPGVLKLDRHVVRAEFEARFSSERMARDYVELYEKLTRPVVGVRKPEALVASGAGEIYPGMDGDLAIAAAARAASAA
jgi:glycosyltransferase involved in cell wall biosynthesis